MRIAIADDSCLFRSGIVALLQAADVEVVSEARNGDELLDLVAVDPPDVAVIDIRMPPSFTDEGLTTATKLHQWSPQTGILILSTYRIVSYATRLLDIRSDAVGYLLKDRVDDLEQFMAALTEIDNGGVVVDPDLVKNLITRRHPATRLDRLSEREREVLQLMAQGRSTAGIAGQLHLSIRTVEAHVAQVVT